MNPQRTLWHDDIHDAIGSAIAELGGAGKVAGLLWPALKPATAEHRLRACLNPDRAERLSPDELLHIMRAARLVGCHVVMDYIAGELSYGCEPLAPEEELTKLLREYNEASREQAKRQQRMEQAIAKIGGPRAVRMGEGA